MKIQRGLVLLGALALGACAAEEGQNQNNFGIGAQGGVGGGATGGGVGGGAIGGMGGSAGMTMVGSGGVGRREPAALAAGCTAT